MTIVTKHITFGNEVLTLTNQRAIYWKREEALILSDVHIGKTAHFRKYGIPVPADIFQKDMDRLKQVILHFGAHVVLVVGDLFHAERNSEVDRFKSWMSQFPKLKWILVKGNHDRLPNTFMEDLNIEVVDNLILGSIRFVHDEMQYHTANFTVSGHTHPGILIKGKGRQKLKIPCYQVTQNQLTLPAFSLFTGLNVRNTPEDATCYAFTQYRIFELQY